MTYSTIIQKRCKCGCTRMPTLGFQGYNMDCRPDLKEKKIKEQKDRQKKRNAITKDQSSLRGLAYDKPEVKAPKDYRSKSELLKEADRLFSLFIRNRDSDKNGNVACVCCGKIYNVEDKDSFGNKVVQCLHFVKREVYSLRFDEDNAAAGCTWCNKDMSDHPKGVAYKQFLSVMLDAFGEDIVSEMEAAHRKINMLEAQQLKNIIEHYNPQTT